MSAPLAWHRSRSAALKKSGEDGPKGKRVVHIFDPIGEALFAAIMERK